MDSVLKFGDVIVLSDDETYFVKKLVKYQNKNYVLIRKIKTPGQPKDAEKAKDELAEEMVSGEELSLKKVEDIEIIKGIKKILTKQLVK